MAKHKTGYAIGVVFCLGLSLTTLLSLAAPAPNIGAAQSPTLTPDPDVINALNQVIRDETCQLPCWWGWILGEDNLADAKSRLEALTDVSADEIVRGDSAYLVVEFLTNPDFIPQEIQHDTFISVSFSNETSAIYEVYLRVYSPHESYVNWSSYTLPYILRKYGIPDEIKTSFAVDLATGYYLTLRFSALHLSIRYRVILPDLDHPTDPNNTFLICNTFMLNYLEVSIMIDETKTSRYFANVNDPNFADFTNIDNAMFWEIFSEDNACIETLPRGQWPED